MMNLGEEKCEELRSVISDYQVERTYESWHAEALENFLKVEPKGVSQQLESCRRLSM